MVEKNYGVYLAVRRMTTATTIQTFSPFTSLFVITDCRKPLYRQPTAFLYATTYISYVSFMV